MPLPVGGDYFKKWNTHAADDGKPKNGEQKTPHAGELTYHAPIRTADGVVNDKTGSVTGWFIVGEENYKDIWRRLAMVPSPEFLIGLTILFENEERMWDGATPLAITEGKLVFTGTPAQNANEAERRNDMARVTVVGFDELLTDVRDIAKRLDNRVGLVLGALILILTAIWLRH